MPDRVGQPAAEREQRGQREQVGVDRPLHAGAREAEFRLDLRCRDRHDRLVDERHRHGEDHGGEHQSTTFCTVLRRTHRRPPPR